MKTSLKFFVLTALMLFSRGCDFYSTSLWFFQPNGMAGEMNPLTRFFGVGWNGLIFTNVLLVCLIVWAFYHYTFRYKPVPLSVRPDNFRDYVSQAYFYEKGKFHQVFYRTPKNRRVMFAHLGYVLIRVVIVGSFLATIHNLCQFYEVGVYDTFREVVKRPLYVISGIIIFSVFYFYYKVLHKEYSGLQRA